MQLATRATLSTIQCHSVGSSKSNLRWSQPIQCGHDSHVIPKFRAPLAHTPPPSPTITRQAVVSIRFPIPYSCILQCAAKEQESATLKAMYVFSQIIQRYSCLIEVFCQFSTKSRFQASCAPEKSQRVKTRVLCSCSELFFTKIARLR